MEYIKGKISMSVSYPLKKKKEILKKLVDALHRLHQSEAVVADSFSIKEAYFHKTMEAFAKIEDLVPLPEKKHKD